MPINRFLYFVLGLTVAAAGGCSTTGDINPSSYIIPNQALNISKTMSIPAESIAAGALLFLIIDPLAPNWQIEQSWIDVDRYRIALTKKRFTTGGDGEAAQAFYRRAAELARQGGATRYRVLEYTEGIESTVPIARRVAQGVVEIVR